jgi:hypothetical protein
MLWDMGLSPLGIECGLRYLDPERREATLSAEIQPERTISLGYHPSGFDHQRGRQPGVRITEAGKRALAERNKHG